MRVVNELSGVVGLRYIRPVKTSPSASAGKNVAAAADDKCINALITRAHSAFIDVDFNIGSPNDL